MQQGHPQPCLGGQERQVKEIALLPPPQELSRPHTPGPDPEGRGQGRVSSAAQSCIGHGECRVVSVTQESSWRYRT